MNEYEKNIRAIHRALGIPAGYKNEFGLALQYEEDDLIEIGKDIYERPQKLARVAVGSWFRMKAQAEEEGLILNVVSAFRGVDKQIEIIQRKIKSGQRIEEILKVCAAPGYSEHHTGRALDLTTAKCKPLSESFEETVAFRWLKDNADSYYFKLSYPKGRKNGIAYEPWHWRFSS